MICYAMKNNKIATIDLMCIDSDQKRVESLRSAYFRCFPDEKDDWDIVRISITEVNSNDDICCSGELERDREDEERLLEDEVFG